MESSKEQESIAEVNKESEENKEAQLKKEQEEEQKEQEKRKAENEEKEQRKSTYQAMLDLEFELPDTQPADLEDVTELIFKAVDLLNDCELLANSDILLETMSSFEAMDKKMDMRLLRREYPHPQELIKKGALIVDKQLDSQQLNALLDEFFAQLCTWQQQNAQVQQTIYSCQYLIKREFYEKNQALVYYIEALHYILYEFFTTSRSTASLRDEDITFPPTIVKLYKMELMDIVKGLTQQISESKDQGILGHLKFIKSLLLMIVNTFQKEDLKEEEKEETKKESKSSKKKKKGAKEQPVVDSLTDLQKISKQMEQSIELISKNQVKDAKLQEWAQSLFDEKIITTLPITQAKKKFTRQSFEQAVQFFQNFNQKFSHAQVIKDSIIYFEDLINELQTFTDNKPCSMIQLMYEKIIIFDNQSLTIFNKMPLQEYFRKGVIEVHPFVSQYYDSDEFQDFYNKFCIILKEYILKALRNKARQRRNINKYFDDLNILLNEANLYDNYILSKTQSDPQQGNTVALTMVINLVLTSSLEMLNRGFELDLYANHELAMIFNYIKYLYQLLIFNRRPQIQGMCHDIAKFNLIDFVDLNKSGDKFKQKRKKFSPLQKQVCDEFEFFKAMNKIYSGMTLFSTYCLKEEIIPDILGKEDVESQVYENRFGVFGKIPFPKYLSYEEYKSNFSNEQVKSNQQLLDQAKQDFIDGKNILQRLIETDENQRNTKAYSKESLEKIQKLAVKNSLNIAMLSMFKNNAIVRINKKDSLPFLPAIDVVKKA